MSLVLPPPKLVLLAVHLAVNADIDSLAFLASRHGTILRKELVLRILLTYLPETLNPNKYVSLVEELSSGEFADREAGDIDYSVVQDLSDEEAARKVRKLHLLPLSWPDAPVDAEDDPVTLFLLRRAYRVDEEAGMLSQLPELLAPFLHHAPGIRTWMVSVLLPLLRRNYEFYPQQSIPYTLAEFQNLSDGIAIGALLSQTGLHEDGYSFIGRDLRGLIGPWLYNDARWKEAPAEGLSPGDTDSDEVAEEIYCPGWERVLEWLTSQATRSWKVATLAVEQWDGPTDVDLGDFDSIWLSEPQQQYLERRYARAVLACAYLIPDASIEALHGAYQMAIKIVDLLDGEEIPSLQSAAALLSPVPNLDGSGLLSPKNTAHMRDDLLKESNPLTFPSGKAAHLLQALILSAFILTQAGVQSTVKRAGDLAFIQDERQQKAEAVKLVHSIASRAPNNDDSYWKKARSEVLWLRSWGQKSKSDGPTIGIFGQVKAEFLENEILKALLSSARYSLARSLYESSSDHALPSQTLKDTIFAAALNAYDNASNPNRTRGGLKKCDDIINAFPHTISKSLVEKQRIEALLKATHSLSEYRLVLKQGEPFSPVVLRVHTDPISIVGKILEQNPKSYTRIQDLLEVGSNMVLAGLTRKQKVGSPDLTPEQETAQLVAAERRITALCIEAALREDDFETAYSYVVNRLTRAEQASPLKQSVAGRDDWSWAAALHAGQYTRTARTIRPTHLGTASGNPEIRHLEQRIECLATALRIAPPSQLQEILKTFRRCEEQLDSAVKEEAAREADEDAAADLHAHGMPGGFDAPNPSRAHNTSSSAAAKPSDDVPMSLFDLSRATARAASRNFTALSTLQRSGEGKSPELPHSLVVDEGQGEEQQRVRKRDQLREAAMGTLVSGVGWLVGAPTAPPAERAARDD